MNGAEHGVLTCHHDKDLTCQQQYPAHAESLDAVAPQQTGQATARLIAMKDGSSTSEDSRGMSEVMGPVGTNSGR